MRQMAETESLAALGNETVGQSARLLRWAPECFPLWRTRRWPRWRKISYVKGAPRLAQLRARFSAQAEESENSQKNDYKPDNR